MRGAGPAVVTAQRPRCRGPVTGATGSRERVSSNAAQPPGVSGGRSGRRSRRPRRRRAASHQVPGPGRAQRGSLTVPLRVTRRPADPGAAAHGRGEHDSVVAPAVDRLAQRRSVAATTNDRASTGARSTAGRRSIASCSISAAFDCFGKGASSGSCIGIRARNTGHQRSALGPRQPQRCCERAGRQRRRDEREQDPPRSHSLPYPVPVRATQLAALGRAHPDHGDARERERGDDQHDPKGGPGDSGSCR